MAQYIRLGQAYFTQADNGTLNYVGDPETIRGLRGGQIPYTSESTTRGLTFGQSTSLSGGNQPSPYFQQGLNGALNSGGTEPSASTSLGGGNEEDLDSLFKSEFAKTLKGLQNSKLPQLQSRQAMLETQKLTAPEPDYSLMTPSAGTAAMNARGSEYDPLIKGVADEIASTKEADRESMQKLSAMKNLMQKDTQAMDVGGRRRIYDLQTGELIRDLGRLNDPEGDGQYTSKQLTALTRLNENVSKNATYAKTSSMRNYGDNVITALSQGTGVSDIAAINQFQKVIDEGAVTRDQDVKLIQQSQSLLNQYKTMIKKLEKGEQLSPEQRTQMKDLVNKMYESQVNALSKDPYIKAKMTEAKSYGLNVQDTILGELGGFNRSDTTQTTQDYVLVNPQTKKRELFKGLSTSDLEEAKQKGYVISE